MQIFPANRLDQVKAGNGFVLDVRTDMEHAEKHLSCSHAHVPLDQLQPAELLKKFNLTKDTDIYILCRSGKRAAKAAEMLIAEGCRNIHVIDGGIVACEECGQQLAGHDVKSATGNCVKGPISLERQVRIAAGSLAALGAFLSLSLHPLFGVIPLAVGCGLIFAGVTDRCGMALLLTKAPWNKCS